MQVLRQVLPQADTTDTAQAAAADTAQAPPDTSALAQFGEDLDRAARYLLSGQWERLALEVYGATAEFVVYYVPRLLGALLIFLFLYALYRAFDRVLERVLGHSKRVDVGLKGLLMKTYRVVAAIFIGIIVLDQLAFNVTAFVAGLSIAGIALAFAARDSLENFISGVIILSDRPFRVGDNIEVADTYDSVEEITLRSTRIRTLNNEVAVMPNTQMITNKLINHTMLGIVRVEVPFGIAYGESPEEARRVLLEMVKEDERMHTDHPPSVVVKELGGSSVNMTLRFYPRNPKMETLIRYEYLEKVRNALTEAGIEIPFPHLQLLIDEAKAFEGSALLQPPRGGNDEATRGRTEDVH